MTDPLTGESRIVQLGSLRRLRIIFDTNLRMSYARGRWERIERVAEARPWLRYVAVQDARTRPEHMAWHGTVLPWDHPFWHTHYPPNGWRCRCTVQQLSADELEEFGHAPAAAPPAGWDETRAWRDRRRGRTVQVPAGIDPGFAHNVGLVDRAGGVGDLLAAKMDVAPGDLARAAVGAPWRTEAFRRHLSGTVEEVWPVATFGGELLGRMADAFGARSRTVRFSGASAAKQAERHPDIEPGDYERIQRIVDRGELFTEEGGYLVGFLRDDDRLWRAVVKITEDGAETYLTSFHPARERNLARARHGLERLSGQVE